MKRHIKVNVKLLQTNKRFSQLKNSQQDWIATELKEHHKMLVESNYFSVAIFPIAIEILFQLLI